ncbi:hypothetical protein C0J52_04856 [Blattella germanica]|nr:hypothetical protein C0J52_04856 [Blattella germanica]
MRRKVEVEGPEELHGMINNIPEDILFEAEAVKHDLIPEKSKDIYEKEYNKFCGGIGEVQPPFYLIAVPLLLRLGGWKSSSVAESYIEECIESKIRIAKKITVGKADENIVEVGASSSSGSLSIEMWTEQQKVQCVLLFAELKSVTSVQRRIRREWNVDPPSRKSIYEWDRTLRNRGSLIS